MKVMCRTLFDCTHTGVTGHFRPQQLPYTTKSGVRLETPEAWNLARNQQRNWETLNQLISLRVLPEDISDPVRDGDCWAFEFSINSLETVSSLDKPLSLLIHDCQNVPMILGLDENNQGVTLTATGDNPNITFELVYNK